MVGHFVRGNTSDCNIVCGRYRYIEFIHNITMCGSSRTHSSHQTNIFKLNRFHRTLTNTGISNRNEPAQSVSASKFLLLSNDYVLCSIMNYSVIGSVQETKKQQQQQ